MQAANHHQPASSFTHLFMRYMDGQIGDRSWKKLMRSFDQGGLTKTEKQAFARFMNEVIADAPSVARSKFGSL